MAEVTCKDHCRKYDMFEVSVKGEAAGNPFTEQTLTGVFMSKGESKTVRGFYDGDGIYKIRFMPQTEGMYQFVLKSSFTDQPMTGRFYVGKARENNHGVVHTKDTYHFAYADGTPYVSIGTTCYVWHLESNERIRETLEYLQKAGFNKMRFCVFPKHYAFNLSEPRYYPYEGTPMDSSVLNDENFMLYTGKTEGNNWDFTRFNPVFFKHLDNIVEALNYCNIEADLILMHPYDRWGFSSMPREAADLYYDYMINRYAAYSNVWWSLANEYDLFPHQTMEDWEHYGNTLQKKDPYGHLRSIHNCRLMYDHSRPWITHCSVQRVDLYKGAELVDDLRTRYGKPVVMDEIAYEGDIQYGWGNITAEEMTRRFWETAVRGGYPGHGETYLSEDGKLWWSHGGKLKGESWKRFKFLMEIVKAFPESEIAPLMNEWDSVSGSPECEWYLPVKSMYLYYYSFMRPSFREFFIDETTHFKAEVIDTWNMTIEDAGVYCGKFKVNLPVRQYMAVRLTKTEEACRSGLTSEEIPEKAVEDETADIILDLPEPSEPVEEEGNTEQIPVITEEEDMDLDILETHPSREEEPLITEEEDSDFMEKVDKIVHDEDIHNNETDEIPMFFGSES